MVPYIRFTYPKKIENSLEISHKVFLFFTKLKEIEPKYFSDWCETANSKKSAMEKKVIFEKDFFLKIVEKKWDKKFPELGTSLSFWSGNINEESNFDITLLIGKTTPNKNLFNTISLGFSDEVGKLTNVNSSLVLSIRDLFYDVWGKGEFFVCEE